VYTPEPLRGRGYGSAVTAAMVESLQPHSTSIMLFADADNPASNRVYERLGFEVRATHVEVLLTADTVREGGT
jgi:predicted GNAT family acetyltransferase